MKKRERQKHRAYDDLHLITFRGEPEDPPIGFAALWLSDGTIGEEGDVFIKINKDGTVKTAILVRYSEIT